MVISKAINMFGLVLLCLTASSLVTLNPVKASVENVATLASITVQPENPVAGQSIKVTVQLYPSPPPGEVFANLSVVLVSPAQGVSGYGPWSSDRYSSDENGVVSFTFNVVSFGGTWNVDFFFPGQYFANNTLFYQRGDWQKNFFVASAQTPTPTPTEFSTLGPIEIMSSGNDNVKIFTPQNNSSINGPIQLSFRVTVLLLPYSAFGNVGYNVDGGTIYSVNNFINMTRVQEIGGGDNATVWGEVALIKLSEGSHSVTVYFGYQFSGIGQRYEVLAYSTANFLVSSNSSTPAASPSVNPTPSTAPVSANKELPLTLAIAFLIASVVTVTVLFWRKHLAGKQK